MNDTSQCSCGDAKQEAKPFCDECWDILPAACKARIIEAADMNRKAKEKTESCVHSAEAVLRAIRTGKI